MRRLANALLEREIKKSRSLPSVIIEVSKISLMLDKKLADPDLLGAEFSEVRL
jgi:hypothetical protein